MVKAARIRILLDMLMEVKNQKILYNRLKTLRGSGLQRENKLPKGNFDNYGIKSKNRAAL